jgi:hypothetical protein
MLGLGVHLTRVCLTLYVALSGFDCPLSGLLLPGPLSHVSGPSVLGVFPFRALLPLKSASLSRSRMLSCPWLCRTRPGVPCSAWTSERCSLQRALFCNLVLHRRQNRCSHGVVISEVFPLRPLPPFQAASSFALFVHYLEDDDNEPGALEFLCRRTA